MKDYKLLLFDMDGTIADTDEMVYLSFVGLYKRYGHGFMRPREEIMYFSGPPIRETLLKEFPNEDQEEVQKAFVEISDPLYEQTLKLFPHELEVLEHLFIKGYKMGVVTNKATYKAKEVLKMLGIEKYFSIVIGREDVVKGKPCGEGIITAMNKLGFNKDSTLYIGDNDIDYLTATDAGVDCMLVSWGPRTLNLLDKAKYVIKKYEEMEEIL